MAERHARLVPQLVCVAAPLPSQPRKRGQLFWNSARAGASSAGASAAPGLPRSFCQAAWLAGRTEVLSSRMTSNDPATTKATPARDQRAREASFTDRSPASVLGCGSGSVFLSAAAFPAASTSASVPPSSSQAPLLSNASRRRNFWRNFWSSWRISVCSGRFFGSAASFSLSASSCGDFHGSLVAAAKCS